MKFATTLTLAALGLSLSSASMADDCVKQTFTNVKDNSWSAVTWDAEKSGLFAVTLKQSSNHFGAWGKNGKLRMQIQVNGQWQYAEGHTESGTAYHGARDVKDTLDTDEGITGIRLQTPTWTSKTGGGTIEVCSNSVEDIVHSAPTFKTGRTFSEEQPAWTSGVQSHQPISSLSCFGRYCDNMKAEFRTDSLVATQGKDWWSHKFSEENNGNAQCPTNHAVTEVQCRGDYCDDLTLKCTPLKDATIYETYKTNWISEEDADQGLNVADCDDGVVIGAACKGRYCDEIQLTCGIAAPNRATMFQQRWEYEGCTTTIPQDRVDHFIGNNRSWTQVKGALQDFATSTSDDAIETCRSVGQMQYKARQKPVVTWTYSGGAWASRDAYYKNATLTSDTGETVSCVLYPNHGDGTLDCRASKITGRVALKNMPSVLGLSLNGAVIDKVVEYHGARHFHGVHIRHDAVLGHLEECPDNTSRISERAHVDILSKTRGNQSNFLKIIERGKTYICKR